VSAAGVARSDFDEPVELTGDGPRIVGGRCTSCGAAMFPRRASCADCGGSEVERLLLPAVGTLWSFTVQGFAPKSPPYVGPFEPFAVGYVEFDGLLRVQGRLTEADPERLRIGAPMRVTTLEVGERLLYAFEPVED
jgi:uncharacterized protein